MRIRITMKIRNIKGRGGKKRKMISKDYMKNLEKHERKVQ